MKKIQIFSCLLFVVILASCRKEDLTLVKSVVDTFETSTKGWAPIFADYPVGEEEFHELDFQHTNLPTPLDQSVKALKVQGNNHSDDLLTMIYRKVDSLEPNTTYKVIFNLDLASRSPKGGAGTGGSPDLCLGAGGLPYQPKAERKPTSLKDYYRPNFESEIQGCRSNQNLKVIGTVGVSESPTQFVLINRNNVNDPFLLRTNEKGEAWMLIGLDSGFESLTTLYYKRIEMRFYK